jgi:uncharacterized damage-inducible protein DinB
MSSIRIQNIRRWFEYECDAHKKVFTSLDSVPESGRASAEYRRAVTLMSHLVAARRAWLSRLGITNETITSLFDESADVRLVANQWEATRALWSQYLTALDESGLDQVIEYKSIDSGRFQNSVEEVLTQLFGHSWYHRGQIAMLVRTAGGTPAMTDWIFWCRRPVEDVSQATNPQPG